MLQFTESSFHPTTLVRSKLEFSTLDYGCLALDVITIKVDKLEFSPLSVVAEQLM